jgi:hypothetical protein
MNVRFIKRITDAVNRERTIIGVCVYYALHNGNRVKTYCLETGVTMEIINKKEGKVDSVFLPFKNYFQPTQCSKGAPMWYQHIEGDHWYFEKTYSHVVPKVSDYINLARAMEDYMRLFE